MTSKTTVQKMQCRTLTIICMVVLAACVGLPDGGSVEHSARGDYAQTIETAQRKFVVSFEPQELPLALNRIHSWRIRLSTITGAKVDNATIFVGGGMPDHGHGFPTRPIVFKDIAAGEYVLEGMKFSMHGRWEIKLGIQASEQVCEQVSEQISEQVSEQVSKQVSKQTREVFDVATFNVMVPLPAVRQ